MSDLIYRQQAIEALDGFRCGTKVAWKVIEDLPSAQPVNYGSTKSDSSSQLKLNNDLISRQGILNELDVCDYELKDWQRWKLKMMVRDIPSAQPTQTNADSTQCKTLDCVSRQDAIDAHCELCPDQHICCPIRNGNICPDVEVFRLLPYAQPVNYGSTKSDSSSQLKLNNDLISRQQAIDALGEEPEVWEDDDEYGMGQRSEWCHIKKIIERLPSAQPERKKGKWILDTFQIRCNRCNKLFSDNLFPSNYCPNCGARMDGESDG